MKTLLLAALLLGSPSHATPVTWEVDALLQSGGQVAGSFVFDADLDACSDVNIHGSSPIVGEYTFTRNPYVCDYGWLVLVERFYSTGLGWTPQLTNDGDSHSIVGGYFGSVDDAGGVRVMGGTVAAHTAPEPASAWLLGIAGLALLLRTIKLRRS